MKLAARLCPSVFPAAAALTTFLFSSAASAEVWVVDVELTQYSDFTSIADAVAAASDGDTILVMGPDKQYAPVIIDGKALTVVIQGEGVAIGYEGFFTGSSYPSIHVRNLNADQSVVVRGGLGEVGVLIEDNLCSVWIDDFFVDGFSSCVNLTTSGAVVRNSAAVIFTGSWLVAESSDYHGGSIGPTFGMDADSSTIYLFDTVVTGTYGKNSPSSPGKGGPGMRIEDSTVVASASWIRGGPGGLLTPLGGDVCTASHATGGTGVQFVGSDSVIRKQDSYVGGGFADLAPLCPGVTGPVGFDSTGTGTIETLPGPGHRMTLDSPVRSGDPIQFQLFGVPGELAAVLLSPDPGPLPFPAMPGVLLGDLASTLVVSAGVIPPWGNTIFHIDAPSLGSASSLTLHAQAAHVDATPATWLGDGGALVILDDDPVPYAYSPEPLTSWKTEPLSLSGGFLDEVFAARLGGDPVNIVSQTADSLVLERTTTSTPGRADLELDTAAGTEVLEALVEMLPTLEVSLEPGGDLIARMNLTSVGPSLYNLIYSLGAYPSPLALPGIHYGLVADLSAPSAIFATGVFTSSGVHVEEFDDPTSPGLSGVTVYFQAWMMGGAPLADAQSFTNLASVTF